MADKPKPKRDIAIINASEEAGLIIFDAVPDAVQGLDEFGDVWDWSQPDRYALYTSALYDFDDIVKYIEGLGG